MAFASVPNFLEAVTQNLFYMKKKILLLTALIYGSQLLAQDTIPANKKNALEEVVVTATKFSQKQSSTGKVVTVIPRTLLEQQSGRTVTEILNQQAGIFINGANNSPGANQDIYLRGASTGNTLILIDGIPMSDPSYINNGFDLNSIAVTQVERIEILKGAQSTLWGSDAVAGVINIITRKESNKKISPSALLSYGSFNTFRGSAAISGNSGKWQYLASHQYTSSKGFSAAYDSTDSKNYEKDGLKQHNTFFKTAYQINDHFTIGGMFSRSKYKASLDPSTYSDDADYTADNLQQFSQAEIQYKKSLMRLHLSQTFSTSERIYIDDSVSIGGFAKYSDGKYTGKAAITDLYGNFNLGKGFSLVSGIQFLQQKTAQSYFSISSFGPYETALGDSAKTKQLSVYSSILYSGPKGLFAELGARFNNHSIYGNNSTFTFNPSWKVNKLLRVFVNVSSAYKIPSLYQLFSEYGNKDLKPERSMNYEGGFALTAKDPGTQIRFVYFKRDIKDLIVFYTDANWVSTYINRDAQHDHGIEVEASAKIRSNIYWNLNYSWVDGKGENEGVKEKNLYRRPNHMFNTSINWNPIRSLRISPSIRYIGTRMKGPYDPGPDKMPAYHTIDIYAGYQFSSSINVFADLRNITNKFYADVPGYNSRGLNIMTGLSVSF